MRKKRLLFSLLLSVLLIGTALSGCKGKEEEKTDPTDSITVTLDQTDVTLFERETVTLTATVSDPEAKLEWKVLQDSIAALSVAEDGKSAEVTAISGLAKTTVVVLIDNKEKAHCDITVKKKKLEVNLPAGKLVLDKTGDLATVKAKLSDSSIAESALTWSSDNNSVAVVKAQGAIATVTAIAEGACTVSVSGKTAEGETAAATFEVVVRKTVDNITRTYYAFTAGGVRSEKQFVGLSNAINELVNNSAYGANSYITTIEDTESKVYTYTAKSYHFFTRSGVYTGFDDNSHVTNGQANWWADFYKDNELNLFKNTDANMLQVGGGFANSWYYRMSAIISSNGNLNNGWGGYRDSLYTAAGAGLNYATWSDSEAYGISRIELNYDLSNSVMIPSNGSQSVYAEIYLRAIVGEAADKTKYYGAFFDAGTKATTSELADGAKGYWYAFEGSMCYVHSDGITYPFQSKRTLNDGKPIGFSTWNKSAGRWETKDLKVQLSLGYRFTNETQDSTGFAVDYKVTGKQGGAVNTVDYTYTEDKTINRSAVRFTYGVSFTPKAKLQEKENDYGFYNNAEIPDLYNGGSWSGVKQGACTGYNASGAATNDLSFIGSGTRQYVSIWGTDVCTYKKDAIANTTTFYFQF